MSNDFYGFAFHARIDKHLNRITRNYPEEVKVKYQDRAKGEQAEEKLAQNVV